MIPHLRTVLCLGALAALPACYASNVVADTDRMVVDRLDALVFAPAGERSIDGLWGSVEITGDAALSLRKVYYCFLPGGSYTAAALVDDGAAPGFQTLSGTYGVTAAGLVLDGAEPVALEQAPDHLRITAPNGSLVLRKEAQQ